MVIVAGVILAIGAYGFNQSKDNIEPAIEVATIQVKQELVKTKVWQEETETEEPEIEEPEVPGEVIPNWINLGKTYKIGDIVLYKGRKYKCTLPHISIGILLPPDRSIIFWRRI